MTKFRSEPSNYGCRYSVWPGVTVKFELKVARLAGLQLQFFKSLQLPTWLR